MAMTIEGHDGDNNNDQQQQPLNEEEAKYRQTTIDALIDFRRRLKLPSSSSSSSSVVPALLEPPVWDVKRQMGVCPRSGRTCGSRRITKTTTTTTTTTTNGNDDLLLLPSHFRLFPKSFMESESPFHHDHDGDLTLCRFLRARNYDVDKALELYEKALKIRNDWNADHVLKQRDSNEICWQYGTPQCQYGHDKLGRPIYIERSGLVRVGKLMEPKGFLTFDDFNKRHIVHMEILSRRIQHAATRFQSQSQSSHVSQLSVIMDLKGLSYLNDTRGMKLFRDTIDMDQAAYPEILGNLFFINAPMIFRGMFALIRGWLDPKTATKFHVLGSDYTATLLQYVDAEDLPIEYGGTNPLPIPVTNYDLIPTERPKTYTGILGLDEYGTYPTTSTTNI